jgi:hypothetical protein
MIRLRRRCAADTRSRRPTARGGRRPPAADAAAPGGLPGGAAAGAATGRPAAPARGAAAVASATGRSLGSAAGAACAPGGVAGPFRPGRGIALRSACSRAASARNTRRPLSLTAATGRGVAGGARARVRDRLQGAAEGSAPPLALTPPVRRARHASRQSIRHGGHRAGSPRRRSRRSHRIPGMSAAFGPSFRRDIAAGVCTAL